VLRTYLAQNILQPYYESSIPDPRLWDGARRPDERTITGALDAEDGRWLMSSFERLRRFGYRFDTY
jgi:hypothetical protein